LQVCGDVAFGIDAHDGLLVALHLPNG